jgi:thiol:disulfide interchange protein
MNQRTRSGIRLLAVITVICAVTAGILEYYQHTNSVEWISYAVAFERAAETKKMVYVDFYADWCVPCKQMDKTTFANDTVIALLKKDFFAVRVNVDDPMFSKTIVSRYNVRSMPTSMLLTADKIEVKRAVGYMNAAELVVWLKEKK